MSNTTHTTNTNAKKIVRNFVADADKVQTMLDALQTGRMSRILTAEDITTALAQAEKEMTRLRVSKKARAEIEIVIDLSNHRQPSTNSYSYRATVTVAVLKYAAKGWFVEEVKRQGASSDTLANARDFKIIFHDAAEKEKAIQQALNLAGMA